MKKLLLAALPLFAFAQNHPHYWQQEVHYKMDIDFDVEEHQFSGTQELTYINNSPDTLDQVFYHLYFNAFQPRSMMDMRSRNLPDPDKRVGDRISKLDRNEIGYHKIISLHHGEVPVEYKISETVLRVKLQQPILPGDSTVFTMNFESQVPVQIRRSGRNNEEGIDYTMTQWYPKIAEYDEHGWHPDPYVAREFYGAFGTFDINILIDHNYKLGGTGVLKNASANWGITKQEDGLTYYDLLPSKKGKREWKFHAENVHDFAWAADRDYIRTSIYGPDSLELNFFYLKKYRDNWEELPAVTARFFKMMNERFGKYDYPQFSVIQGGDGGMEYPMCTMLKGSGKMKGLIGVMVHESVHNWYYGMMASNENQYPWMDEGFTSFAEEEILNAMSEEPKINAHLGAYAGYIYLLEKGHIEPMSTPADYFDENKTYGISSYSRGELFLSQLRYILGEEDFNKGMLEYYDQWKFKHPDPWDFLKVMEEVSGLQLDWYYNFWINTVKTIDYGIAEVQAEGRGVAKIVLERVGNMPMPVDITIVYKSGGEDTYTIPMVSMFGYKNDINVLPATHPWPWTSPVYELFTEIPVQEIKAIIIDKNLEMADTDRENNIYEMMTGETGAEE